jgi:hypothetical protein
LAAAQPGNHHLSAFDKMCGRTVTLGLESPRRPKRLPVVLSQEEISYITGTVLLVDGGALAKVF